MNNPILQILNNSGPGNLLNLISSLKSGNPDAMLNCMLQSNPQFRQFVQMNQGKTPEQIARENGIDFDAVKNLLR